MTLPDSLEDSAVLSGYFPTGTITFTLYSGTTLLDTEPVSVSGNGTYTTPNGYTLPTTGAAGTYQWDTSYSGNDNNYAVSDNNDASEQVAVSLAIPSLSTTPSPFTLYNIFARSCRSFDTATPLWAVTPRQGRSPSRSTTEAPSSTPRQ